MAWLVRSRLTSMCLFVLLFALTSISGETMSAQSSSTAPAEGQPPSSIADLPVIPYVRAPNSSDPAKQFSKALQVVKKRGRHAHVADYITSGLGIRNASVNLEPLWASVVEDSSGQRTIYLLEDTNAAVLITEAGGTPVFYLARAGVLKQAAVLKSGRWGSKSLQDVPLKSAVAGFNTERDFWIEALAAMSPADSPSKK